MTTTWVPSTSFVECARVLDRRRLGAQRGEGLIVLRALTDPYATGAWANHPAVRMWRGHARAFCAYSIAICREWRARGFEDGCLEQYVSAWCSLDEPVTLPDWWGVHPIHEQHRRELVRRLPEHYGPIWPDVEPTTEKELVWPK